MKRNIIATFVVVLAGAFVIGCNLWGNKKNQTPVTTETKSITGTWKIAGISDSSSLHKANAFIPAVIINDSLPAVLELKPDSSFSVSNKDSVLSVGTFYTDSSLQKIFIKQGAAVAEYSIHALTDSSVEIANTTDSVYYTLKK